MQTCDQQGNNTIKFQLLMWSLPRNSRRKSTPPDACRLKQGGFMRSLLKNKIILLLCLPVVAIALLWTIRSVFENDICALSAKPGTMDVFRLSGKLYPFPCGNVL